MSNRTAPAGWAIATLRDIASPGGAVDPRRDGRPTFKYVDIEAVNNASQTIANPREVSREAAPSRARMQIKASDVLFSLVRPYLKNIAIVPDDLDGQVASTAFCVLRPGPGIESRFLFHQLVQDAFINSVPTYGNSPPAARDDEFFDATVLVAPSREQVRIADRLDELLSDLGAAVAALERARANLKRYRAAVLKAAVEGKLTEEWRKEHPPAEPAEELLERILAERRRKWEEAQLARYAAKGQTPPEGWEGNYQGPSAPDTSALPELPRGWCWASIDQLAIVIRGASPRPAGDPMYFGSFDVPWITVGALTATEDIYLKEVSEWLTQAGRERSRFIEADTLLLTNSGATLGVPKITLIGGCINDGSVALLGLDYPLKLYLYYFLSSKTRELRSINQGAAQPNLNTAIVKSIRVPLPPAREQREIVSSLEGLLAAALNTRLESEKCSRRATLLRQGILKHAFEGKLVPQDPNDEPASVLLERIRADRAGTGQDLTTSGRRRKPLKVIG